MMEALGVALAWLPAALGLAQLRPERPAYAAAASVAAALALAWATGRWEWGVTGLCAGAAVAYLPWTTRRSEESLRASEDAMAALRARASALAGELERIQKLGTAEETERRRAMAMHGWVRSLGDAEEGETLKTRIDSAAGQALHVEEFSVFLAEPAGGAKLVARRRLGGSPGASWEGLAPLVGHEPGSTEPVVLEKPEPAVVVPVPGPKGVLGWIYLRPPGGEAPRELAGRCRRVACELAFALERLRLIWELERLSSLDDRTGAFRKAAWEARLREEGQRARAFRLSMAVLLIRIDGLEELRRERGKSVSEEAERRAAQLLREGVYDTDVVGRLEEGVFAVLFHRAEAAGVRHKAERLRQSLAEEPFGDGLEPSRLSFPAGLAQMPRDAATPEEVLERARAALEKALSLGLTLVDAGERV